MARCFTDKPGLFRKHFPGLQSRPVTTPGGLYLGRQLSFTLDTERVACPRCGASWARVVMASGARANGLPRAAWKPTCGCPPAAPVPCLVLDLFAGTGSALVAAGGLGRRAVGCELNEAFARFGQRRVRGAVGAENDAV